jgi:hypothetical protein
MIRIEDKLAVCLDDIRDGRASLADCLTRQPGQRAELEPLLKIALSIEPASAVAPSPAFRARARVELMEHIHARQSTRAGHLTRTVPDFSRAWQAGWAKAVAVIAAVAVVFGLAGGSVRASQESLPGDILYPVKLDIEEIQRAFTTGDASAVALELRFADIRLQELKAVATLRPEQIPVAAAGYQASLTQAVLRAEKITDKVESALEMAALAVLKDLPELDQIADSTPAARETAGGLVEAAIGSHVSLTASLARTNPAMASILNQAALENRLSRAHAEEEKGNRAGAEKALNAARQLRVAVVALPEEEREQKTTGAAGAQVPVSETGSGEATDKAAANQPGGQETSGAGTTADTGKSGPTTTSDSGTDTPSSGSSVQVTEGNSGSQGNGNPGGNSNQDGGNQGGGSNNQGGGNQGSGNQGGGGGNNNQGGNGNQGGGNNNQGGGNQGGGNNNQGDGSNNQGGGNQGSGNQGGGGNNNQGGNGNQGGGNSNQGGGNQSGGNNNQGGGSNSQGGGNQGGNSNQGGSNNSQGGGNKSGG